MVQAVLPNMAPSEQWRTLLHRCLAHRIDVDEFKELSKLMLTRFPVNEEELLNLLLEARATSTITWDPLLPLYVDALCKIGQAKPSSALTCLLKHSSILDKIESSPDSEPKQKRKASTLMTDIKVIQDVMLSVSTGSIPKTIAETAQIYSATVDWIDAVVAWHNNGLDLSQQSGGMMNSPDAVSLFESLGILLAALSGTGKGLEVLSGDYYQGKIGQICVAAYGLTKPCTTAVKTKLGQALFAYLPLCVDVSLPLRQRLDGLQKEFNLYGDQTSKPLDDSAIDGMNVNALQFEASVMDGPVMNARAGLYVYINAMVRFPPLFNRHN